MNPMLSKLTFATALAAAAFTFPALSSHAQDIFVTEGGRTTLTMSKAFLADLATIGATPTAVAGSQVLNSQIYFPITGGAISLSTARGQVLHAGGINLTTATKQVKLDTFIVDTLGEEHFVTALVVVDGRFLGRIKVFDLTLPSTMTLPIDPKNGDFFLAGVRWDLDPEGAVALNDAFGTKIFADDLFLGNSLSLVFVPLNADGL